MTPTAITRKLQDLKNSTQDQTLEFNFNNGFFLAALGRAGMLNDKNVKILSKAGSQSDVPIITLLLIEISCSKDFPAIQKELIKITDKINLTLLMKGLAKLYQARALNIHSTKILVKALEKKESENKPEHETLLCNTIVELLIKYKIPSYLLLERNSRFVDDITNPSYNPQCIISISNILTTHHIDNNENCYYLLNHLSEIDDMQKVLKEAVKNGKTDNEKRELAQAAFDSTIVKRHSPDQKEIEMHYLRPK